MMVDTSFASISVPFLCCLQFVGTGGVLCFSLASIHMRLEVQNHL